MDEAQATHVVPAPYRITGDDKRGLVMVVTTTTLSFVVACLLVRIYVRTKVKEWKRDDSLLAVATLFCCFQAVTVYVQVHEGLGLKHNVPARLSQLGKANLAQQLLYIFTLFLSKCVVLLLYLRLTAGKKHALLAYVTISVCGVWIVLSIILISINCNSIGWFTQGLELCGDITWRWIIICVFDILTELLIFYNALYLVNGLHMAFRLKVIVVFAFSIRLPVIIASAIRMHYIREMATSANTPFHGAYSVVAGQFQLDLAIMASTISCIGPFLRPFEKEGGGGSSYRRRYYAERRRYPSVTGGGPSHQRSFNDSVSSGTAIKMGPIHGGAQLHKQQHKHNKPILGHRDSAFFRVTSPFPDSAAGRRSLDFRPDFCEHEAGAARGSTTGVGIDADLDQLSLNSNDSKRMIISKKTVVKVEREGETAGESLAGDRKSAGSLGDSGPGIGRAYTRS